MTYLCVPIFVTEIEKARRDIALAAEAGAEMVELRIDEAAGAGQTEGANLERLVADAGVPCIVTCRPSWEGGRSDLPDDARVGMLRRTANAGASYIDVEVETYRRRGQFIRADGGSELDDIIETPRDARTGLIFSAHDFAGRPTKLASILQSMWEGPADVAKVVWTARTIRDNLEAFEILLHRPKPTIALCMGEHGVISRILAKKFGAFLTFASLAKDAETAPGQVTVEQMKLLYRWDAIGRETKVYGVVASPVMHSMSPAIHNAAFEAVGHNGVYLPMLVNPGYESFKAFMESFLAFEPLDLAGLSVTLPHKENALRYLTEKGAEVEELARGIGAVNTIVVERGEGSGFRVQGSGKGLRLRGFNTDYAAILDSITARMGITREELGDYRVAVIGAGGTGRTAVAALAHYGATVVVYNRTKEKADALAKEFDGKTGRVVSARMEKLCDSCCQVFINCTSVGMYPNVDASPIGERTPAFTAETVVFDTIYNPMKTKLLEQAEGVGAKTISGVEMFVRQAMGQLEAWTGKKAPEGVMRGVIEERLAT
jgi:3-dehydroquinate dehydratase/shikimate dehydrogenase